MTTTDTLAINHGSDVLLQILHIGTVGCHDPLGSQDGRIGIRRSMNQCRSHSTRRQETGVKRTLGPIGRGRVQFSRQDINRNAKLGKVTQKGVQFLDTQQWFLRRGSPPQDEDSTDLGGVPSELSGQITHQHFSGERGDVGIPTQERGDQEQMRCDCLGTPPILVPNGQAGRNERHGRKRGSRGCRGWEDQCLHVKDSSIVNLALNSHHHSGTILMRTTGSSKVKHDTSTFIFQKESIGRTTLGMIHRFFVGIGRFLDQGSDYSA